MKKLTFESMLKKTVYKDRDALYELVPPEGLVGRIKERNELVVELAPILLSSPVSSVFIYGPPGTGKTALTLQICRELHGEAKKNKVHLRHIYINCSENRTEHAILTEMLSHLSNTEIPKTGWSTKKVIGELRKHLSDNKQNILVVLDEVDYLLKESGDDVLYRLSRINEGISSKVSSLFISNDLRVYDYLTPRTQSSFGRIKIIFSPYATEELTAILANRAAKALIPGATAKAVIQRIADMEAERGGDARKALEVLDSCAKIAVAQGRNTISLDMVKEADANLERDTLIRTIEGLTKHQKIVYLTLLKSPEEVPSSEAYKEYIKECVSFKVEPLSERRVRTFIILFSELGLITSEVGWVSNLKKKSRKITLTIDTAIKTKIRKRVRDAI